MKTLSKDARGFIDSVASYVRSDARSKTAAPKVQLLITKVTAAAKKEENAQVQSAVALLPDEKKRIESLLVKLLGHTVTCHYSIDASFVGGIKIQVADWVVDSSLTTQLASISRTLLTV
jgi:F-type H+-transporting ATPase subunit delta